MQLYILVRQVGDLLTDAAHHVVMGMLVHLHAQGAVMDGKLAKHAALHKQVNVLVDGGQGDGRNPALHRRKDLFRRGVAVHALHGLVQHLALVRHGNPVL